MRKVLISTMLLSVMVLGSIGASAESEFKGWKVDKTTQEWNYIYNGEKMHDGVIQQGSKLYYFDSLGNLINGWSNWGNARMYYVSGVPVKGWRIIEGKWYFFNNSGVMLTGEILLSDGKTYNLASDGHLIE